MLRPIFAATIGLLFAGSAATAGDGLADCAFNGIDLWGEVEVVDSFPDIEVQVVDSFPDLNVEMVGSFPDNCGQWQMVDSFPDFTIQFVDSFPDIEIEFVDGFPGLP